MPIALNRSLKPILAIVAILVCVVATTAGPRPAAADTWKDALKLERSGDIDRIEKTYAQQYQDFLAGKMTLGAMESTYETFYTLDPVVLKMIVDWRRKYPNSPYALIAEANTKLHLAAVLRGNDSIDMVPHIALQKALKLWQVIEALTNRALEISPDNVNAAETLGDAASWMGDAKNGARASRIEAKFFSPRSILLGDLHDALPQWGGSVARMHYLCTTRAPKIKDISVKECEARVTLMLSDSSRKAMNDAIQVLRHEHFEMNRFFIADHLLQLGQAKEALKLYDEIGVLVPSSLARAFGRELNNMAVQERIVDRWLAINPPAPRHLAIKAEAQLARHDIAGAIKSVNRAMQYGRYIPEVRLIRLKVMFADPKSHGKLLSEIESALADTDVDPTIEEFALFQLVWDPRYIRYNPGDTDARLQCRKLRILSLAMFGCSREANRQSTLGCSDDTLRQVQNILSRADLNQCKNPQSLGTSL